MWENYCDTGRCIEMLGMWRSLGWEWYRLTQALVSAASQWALALHLSGSILKPQSKKETKTLGRKRRKEGGDGLCSTLKWQKIPDTSIKLVDKMIITNHKWFSFFFFNFKTALSNLIKTCLCLLSVPLFHLCNTLWKYLWDHKTRAGQQLMASNSYGSYPWWGPV